MNRQVLVSGVVIGVLGITTAIGQQKPISRVILGAYIFTGLLALLDAFGGILSQVASGLALVAMTTAVVTLAPGIGDLIGKVIKGAPKAA